VGASVARRNAGLDRLNRVRRNNEMRRATQRLSTNTVSFSMLYDLVDNDNLLQGFENHARYAYGAQGEVGNTVVFAAIDRRASVFSEAVFKWRNKRTKKLWSNDNLAKLETPWPNGTTGSLLTRMEQDVSLAGNAYIRDCGYRLERLRPDWVWIVSKLKTDDYNEVVREIVGYYYNPLNETDREPAYYPVEEVAHWAPIPDPLANFRGMSWITPVIREIHGDTTMSEFRDAYFRNAASPNVVIKYQQKIGPDRIKRLQNQIRERHSGAENAFDTMVLDEGADMTVIGHSMEGAAFDDLQAAGEARILMASGVPAMVVGAREGIRNSKIGEYDSALRSFADLKMRPNWRSACASLAKLVAVPADSELWFDTGDVSALRQGEKDMADTMVQQAAAANQLFMAGYEPQSIIDALSAGDLTLLTHTGLTSVQAQLAGSKRDLAAQESIQQVSQADLQPSGAPAPAAPAAPTTKVNGNKPALASSAAKG
jgi:phage portal protein BeeE